MITMTTNSLWEIFVEESDYSSFCELLEDHGHGGFTASIQRDGFVWVICYTTDEVKILASLRFNIRFPENKFGIDISENRLS